MFSWLFFAIFAQFLSALTVFIDKYVLVSKQGIKYPAAFAFYAALLSGVVIVLVPFGVVSLPSVTVALLSVVSGSLYVLSLLFLYRVLQVISVTEAIPITAAAGAVATGILATIFLAGDLHLTHLPAFLLLILGTFLIYCFCFSWKFFFMTVSAGALLGASTFVVKIIFGTTDFWNALFWPLFTNVLVALFVLAPLQFRSIKKGLQQSSGTAKGMVLVSKSFGGIAFFFTFIAISLGSVSLVSALGGLQLLFLLILVPLFMHQMPDIFKNEFSSGQVYIKIVGTLCVIIGLGLLFL
ncbi:hypothetical protein COU15_00650 [Candidatus Kaiserbacteria bacterium CG10_big_fil_rev_8_21_14_0_10_45_20]|uniref:EamA domain-containing protein n=1 Tax=Candidatus Kaiserbacteria bacterium CG10_big_fil_rev_8_21_14_0_10_45_20 TaxID=1974607 RepID=A0A2H0UGC1_9BACT|nr:MAG: hypothetical protein COU15_00650 [Candidatus Kaiserbacteria bacterium CG10_big_fil_rev_8_21_14_0_10_45_20]